MLRNRTPLTLLALLLLAGCTPATQPATVAPIVTPTPADILANLQPFPDATGTAATFSTAGEIDESTAFFQPLGTNGRTCASCHSPSQGMSINAASTLALFDSSNGTDPLFAAIDGANCPTAATGNSAAHSLIINNGLIRIPIELPAGAQFTLTVLSDPYGCAVSIDPATGRQIVSVYRRPPPASSLTYLSNVMWDTRETIVPLNSSTTYTANLATDLTSQMVDAVTEHEQGTATPTAAQLSAMLSLEEGLYTAQSTDNSAGSLSSNGATGGPTALAAVTFYPGINDDLGADPTGKPFSPAIFNLYTAWVNSTNPQQASIARGEGVFNNAPMQLGQVAGLSTNPIPGTCGTCHDTPDVGDHSLPVPLDTAVSRIAAYETNPPIIAGVQQLSAPTLPIYQINGCTGPGGAPVVFTTTDPGKALFTGLCSDVNRIKVPILRGLAARAPYFHNGSATNLAQVVAFYNARFQMNLNPQQQADLVNFLSVL